MSDPRLPRNRAGGIWDRLTERLAPAEDRPRLRDSADVEVANHHTRAGTPYVVLKNRATATPTYLRLTAAEAELLPLMDGTRTVGELVVQYFLRQKVLAFQRVAGLVAQLRSHGFLRDGVPVSAYTALGTRLRARSEGRLSRWARELSSWIFGREVAVSGLDRMVGALYRRGGWLLFTRPAQSLTSLLAALGVGVFAVGLGSTGAARLFRVGDSYAFGILALVAFALLSTAVHELGHALALKRAGREVRRAGFMFYYGLPTFFVDTTDVWMANARARVLVSWAGPYTALVLGGIASLGSVLAGPGVVGDLLFAWALVSYLDVLFNLNPLLELDGYYLLVDALERPLLRRDALAFVRGPLWRKVVRKRAWLTGPERLLAVFGLASAAWSLFSIWLAVFLWERRLASLVLELLRAPGLLPRLVLALLVSAVSLGIVLLAQAAARPLAMRLYRSSVMLARQGQALWRRDAVGLLRALPFLSGVPDQALVEIATKLRRVRVRAGTNVVTQGEVGEWFYLVRRGSLEVVRDGVATVEITQGGYFGEVSLLREVTRSATVVARTPCELLAMRGEDFRTTFAHELETFQRVRDGMEVRAELAALPLLADLTPAELDLLLTKLERCSHEPGSTIVHQGHRGNRFYLLRRGTVAVEVDGRVVNHLGPGDAFGEIALLMDVPRTATVRVVGTAPAETLSLDQADFRDVLARYLGRAGTLTEVGTARMRLLARA